jgi:hypothetical protein
MCALAVSVCLSRRHSLLPLCIAMTGSSTLDGSGESAGNGQHITKDDHRAAENGQSVGTAQPNFNGINNDDSFGSEAVSLLSIEDEEDLGDESSLESMHTVVDEILHDELHPNSHLEEDDLQTSVDES